MNIFEEINIFSADSVFVKQLHRHEAFCAAITVFANE